MPLGLFGGTPTWSDSAPVRAEIFGVERLEQHARSLAAAQPVTLRPIAVPSLRRRLDADRFHYTSENGFEAVLRYDEHGLIVDYPGIAMRFA